MFQRMSLSKRGLKFLINLIILISWQIRANLGFTVPELIVGSAFKHLKLSK